MGASELVSESDNSMKSLWRRSSMGTGMGRGCSIPGRCRFGTTGRCGTRGSGVAGGCSWVHWYLARTSRSLVVGVGSAWNVAGSQGWRCVGQAPPYSVGAPRTRRRRRWWVVVERARSLCLAFVGWPGPQVVPLLVRVAGRGGHSGRGGERGVRGLGCTSNPLCRRYRRIWCPYVRTMRVVKKTVKQKPTMADANPMV